MRFPHHVVMCLKCMFTCFIYHGVCFLILWKFILQMDAFKQKSCLCVMKNYMQSNLVKCTKYDMRFWFWFCFSFWLHLHAEKCKMQNAHSANEFIMHKYENRAVNKYKINKKPKMKRKKKCARRQSGWSARK